MPKHFKPPGEDERLGAIGIRKKKHLSSTSAASSEKVTRSKARAATISSDDYILEHSRLYMHRRSQAEPSADLLKALTPDPDLFLPMPKPHDMDWLAHHPEKGQTFEQFVAQPHNKPDAKRNVIHLLPLRFFEKSVPDDALEALKEYASYFFLGMKVKILKGKYFAKKVVHRKNPDTGHKQVNAEHILLHMLGLVQENSYCVAGITLCDLYPREEWNFVFGLASLSSRCGVYSLARYLPGFGEEEEEEGETEEESVASANLIRRACLLMCHEIGHMFGLRHCIYFKCIMNGSNHLMEFDRKLLFLCPVCLRKLHHSLAFDIVERYKNMLVFCEKYGITDEAEWLRRRISKLQ
ncbi:archaemetzincin-2 [Lingula anatina]|uniref:Archaemetzincin-2 n=1 Tax=Lingula anatina TaxID=7574 RepID=A0A1S3I7D8_LINAN|nr:archaemetzincin-2 [Lingula anatina]|eukprot:XP_013394167.1 archaemetzincin-2 [Lingula anatina]